ITEYASPRMGIFTQLSKCIRVMTHLCTPELVYFLQSSVSHTHEHDHTTNKTHTHPPHTQTTTTPHTYTPTHTQKHTHTHTHTHTLSSHPLRLDHALQPASIKISMSQPSWPTACIDRKSKPLNSR